MSHERQAKSVWFVNTNVISVRCSTKICAHLLKDEGKSPVLDPATRMNISRNINALITRGINGTIKKESVVVILQELVVS